MNKTIIHVIITSKIVFFNSSNNTSYYFSFVLVNSYVYVILDRLPLIKAYNLPTIFA